ncbi:MAG: hypothetical protein GWN94_13695, partial [Phycisphaerae bacterium]|nr:hypothetical protein [Phycisphaerae bacterium]
MTEKVKFYDAGKWAEHVSYLPQIEVTEPGQIIEVSDQLAKLVVDLG